MICSVTHVTVLVRDYDEALDFYTNKLGFVRCDDMPFGKTMRWLTVAPEGCGGCVEVVLSKPLPEMFGENGEAIAKEMTKLVGKSPMIILSSDAVKDDHELLSKKGVEIVQSPTERDWGLEVIFKDLYGNIFCLIESPEESCAECGS